MAVEIPVVIDIDKAFQDAAKRVGIAMEPLQKSVGKLTEDLSVWSEILKESDIEGDEWRVAAKNIQNISEALAEADYALRRYTSNEGSIKQMSVDLAELNRRWDAMGTAQKFNPDGSYSAEAIKAYNQYKKITVELEKQGKSLSQLAREEKQRADEAARLEQKRNQYQQKGIQSRQYENAILNATVKSMRVLTEQERILSNRLSKTAIGTEKYKQLELQLKRVRKEINEIEGNRFKELGNEIDHSNSKLANLIKNSIRLVALHSATRFIHNIREVTAEFELQRVALGSIIQDTQRAEGLFKQIKAAAVQSPFEIKDLVTYTKQLSAYQIETEKIFDTTMKLADISAGLGVDMGRLILAFGQVRAASVLRGQELRQFTEAGIPLVDKLAEKFSELNNRGVTTAEVFELISKRAVPFSMIEEIFDDMTSAGGAFYQMQEKQAETLLGQWNNLKDAVSIMYDEIGNTEIVHSAMEYMIKTAKTMMQNWRTLAEIVKTLGLSFLVVKTASLFIPTLTKNERLAEKATRALTQAQELEAIASTKGAAARTRAISSLKTYEKHIRRASEATTLWARGWNNLLAFLARGGGLSIAISLVTALTGVIVSTIKEARRLDKELSQIGAKGNVEISQSVRTFERLAKTALEAADGSKQQRDALDELKRSFGDISPALDGHIESLRKLEGNYLSITNAIREKVNWQIKEQKITTIQENYGKKLGKDIDNVKESLTNLQFTRSEISAITDAIQDAASQGLINATSSIQEKAKVIEDIIYRLTGRTLTVSQMASYGTGYSQWAEYVGDFGKALGELAETSVKMESRINAVVEDTASNVASLGRYAKVMEGIQAEIENIDMTDNGNVVDEKSYAGVEKKGRETVRIFAKALQDEFNKTGIDISAAFDPTGQIDFGILKEAAKKAATITVSVIDETTKQEIEQTPYTAIANFVDDLQKQYEAIIPSDKIAIVTKRKLEEIANITGLSMDKLRTHIKGAGADDAEYMQGLQEAIDAYNTSAQKMLAINNAIAAGVAAKDTKPYSQEEITNAQQMASALQTLYDYMSGIIKITQKSSGGRDTRLSDLKKEMSELTDAYKKFVDLQKYVSRDKALLSIDEMFPSLAGWEPAYENMLAKLDSMLTTVQKQREKSPKDAVLLDMERAIRSEIANIKFDKVKADLEEQLQKLSDEMKRSETARSFFDNILDLTGDEDIAASMSISVYGGIGAEFKQRMQEQLNAALSSLDASLLTDELKAAFESQDYDTILKNIDKFPDEWQKKLKEMADSSAKYNAEQVQSWLKDLQKVKTYGDKRVLIAKQTAEKIREISESELSQEQKDSLTEGYRKKEAEEVAKLQYDAFKDSPMYVELFSDLDQASTMTLTNMRNQLQALRSEWKNLDPIQLKEMQRRMQELDEQIARRNPFKTIIQGLKDFNALRNEYGSRKEIDVQNIVATNIANTERELLNIKSEEYQKAKEQYDIAVRQYDAESNEVKLAKENLDTAKAELEVQAEMADIAEENANAAQELSNRYNDIINIIAKGIGKLSEWQGNVDTILEGVRDLGEAFGFNTELLEEMASGLSDITQGANMAGQGIVNILKGDIFGGIASIIGGVGKAAKGITNLIYAPIRKRLEDEIVEQQEVVKNLEREYSRLEKAIESAFGSEYIYNYNRQLEILYAQQAAYERMAAAEREKAKNGRDYEKNYKEKAEGYLDMAEDVAEQIRDMQNQLREHFAGTDVASAARNFAKSWIDAYRSFSSTTQAMRENFREMIDNMIVESLAGQLIKELLDPVFEMIDGFAEGGFGEDEIAAIADSTEVATQEINNAMTGLMQRLTAAGLNIRGANAGLTGISREIAGASEQSINALAAGINTQNFYMSYMPIISANVESILLALGGSTSTSATPMGVATEMATFGDDIFRGQMQRIDENLFEMRSMLRSVITLKSAETNTHAIAVK